MGILHFIILCVSTDIMASSDKRESLAGLEFLVETVQGDMDASNEEN